MSTVRNEETPGADSNQYDTLEYYRRFFDVTTDEVLRRLKRSMFPRPDSDFFSDLLRPNPDLYGPFWVSVTLVISLAISNNLGHFIAGEGPVNLKNDFHILSLAATCVLCYCWLVPLAIWGFTKWNSDDAIKRSYLELTCIYGYSLSIFIPVSALWAINIFWWQLSTAIIGTLLSGSVLLKSILTSKSLQDYHYGTVLFLGHLLLSFCLLLIRLRVNLHKEQNNE